MSYTLREGYRELFHAEVHLQNALTAEACDLRLHIRLALTIIRRVMRRDKATRRKTDIKEVR